MIRKERVRLLASQEEEVAFCGIAKYCFNDLFGWSDRIFPLMFGDKAWGCFTGDVLESALVTRNYEARVFSTWQKMSGISFVESLPEHRNKDNVSRLMERALTEERDAGMVFSTLYPFKFRYYEKYGYGYAGGHLATAFQPDDINVAKPQTGEFVPFDGEDRMWADMASVTETWVTNFSFGIRPRPLPLAKAKEELARSKDRIVLYYVDGQCRGFIHLQKVIIEPFVAHLEIRKIAWTDERAFLSLMYFVKKHRDQIREVKWKIPPSVPLALVMAEPRIQMTKLSDWMARPLDLSALLDLKARGNTDTRKISFSIEDKVIPENTGTYTIEGSDVRKKGYTGENLIPLPVFSSILFGGYTLRDARMSGRIDPDFPIEADDFFGLDTTIYLSEFF